MSNPVITHVELALHLNDDNINQGRAMQIIRQSQDLCETVVDPGTGTPPKGFDVVVMRVAARAYVTTTSTRHSQMAMAGSPFGNLPGAQGGIYLTRQDKTDLRRMTGGGGAFSINLLPATYALRAVPYWDVDIAPTTTP